MPENHIIDPLINPIINPLVPGKTFIRANFEDIFLKLALKSKEDSEKSEKEDADFIRNVKQEIQISEETKRKPFKRITKRE